MHEVCDRMAQEIGPFCATSIKSMAQCLERLNKQIAPPRRIAYLDGFVFRYEEKSVHQAIILKLARRVSSQVAAFVLWEQRLLQEQGALHRMLDELDEDIAFLTLSLTNDTVTPLHERYLKEFFQEEFDVPGDAVASSQKRNRVPRKKIQNYVSRFLPDGVDNQIAANISNTLHKIYSGYVHSAGVHALELYGGNPPRFHVFGFPDLDRVNEHGHDLVNYFFRGLISANFAAKAFGDGELADFLRTQVREFEDELFPDLESAVPKKKPAGPKGTGGK